MALKSNSDWELVILSSLPQLEPEGICAKKEMNKQEYKESEVTEICRNVGKYIPHTS